MLTLDISADYLVEALLSLPPERTVCLLDSCGVGHLGSHLLIAGIDPVETMELSDSDPVKLLATLDTQLTAGPASIFTLSYEFGSRSNGIPAPRSSEPDIFLARFDSLIIHDYQTGITRVVGAERALIQKQLSEAGSQVSNFRSQISDLKFEIGLANVRSNFTKEGYLSAIDNIKERIRDGDTYQTNLTQQLTVDLANDITPEAVFWRLRRDHPAPFAAFIRRRGSTVVSASPERFFRITSVGSPHVSQGPGRRIETSPVKGTRPRGATPDEDDALRRDLLTSPKDRAENTMIVDLLRNDIGRVCEYGSVRVEKLCDLEEHPTLFHLVSTVSGELRPDASFSDILRALFPCGSITGAPKISTMRIINETEPDPRGLSMGAIGYHIPIDNTLGLEPVTDLSVAIRTMVIRDRKATFNVGGGIVIDSDPEKEFEESWLKARALLTGIYAQPVHSIFRF